jgi:hypothetical protein
MGLPQLGKQFFKPPLPFSPSRVYEYLNSGAIGLSILKYTFGFYQLKTRLADPSGRAV